MKSDRRRQPSPSGSGLSGPDDDSSPIFSLKALAAKADPSVSATQAAPSVEDSGLIDLKKLMANVEPVNLHPPVLPRSEAGLFDTSETTLMPQVFETGHKPHETSAPKSAKKAKWFAVGLVLVASGVAAMALFHARENDVRASVEPAAPVPTTQVAQTQFVQPAHPVETVVPVQNAAPVPANPTAIAPTARAPQAWVTPQVRERSKPKTKAKPEPAKTPSEPCDLMCEMQRRTQKKK